MQTPLLIGLAAHAPGSGKTSAALVLEERNFARLPMAQPVKDMARQLLLSLGLPLDAINNHLYNDRSAVIEPLGVTGRHLLQTLGTEWGRQCIHPEIWLRCWEARVRVWRSGANNIVVDDIRFPDEADLVRRLGGEMWLITRPGYTDSSGHASEGGLKTYAHFTRTITNDGTLEDLTGKVTSALEAAACREITRDW